MGMFHLLFSSVLTSAFGLATCRGYTSLSQVGSACLNFTVLSCSFRNVTGVRFQDFDPNFNRFNTLSSSRIAQNPDYEVTSGDDVYELKITQAERYNGSLYRCFGFDEDFVAQHSNQWKLSISTEVVCADLEMNVTNTEDPNIMSVANHTKQGDADHKALPAMILALFSILAVLPITAVLVAVAAVLIVLGVQRKSSRNKGGEVVPMHGNPAYLATYSSPQIAGQAREQEILSGTEQLEDMNVPMQGNPAYEAVGNIHPSTHVQVHPPQPQPPTGPEQSQEVRMQGNPAYEATGDAILSNPTQIQGHPLQPSTTAVLSLDIPMQGNPAYEPITPTLVHGYQPQLFTGEELSEDVDVPMQVNPAYGTVDSNILLPKIATAYIEQLQRKDFVQD